MTKTEQTTEPTEDKLRALLPWYVTGEISDQDRELVESGLKDHPELNRELEQIQLERRGVDAAAEQVPVPSDAMWDKLAARMANETAASATTAAEPSASRSASFSDVIAALKAWAAGFAQPLPQMAFTAAALAVIILQAGLIGYLWTTPNQGGTYQTASGGDGTQSDSVTKLLITFRPGATIDRVSNLLRHIGAETVSGPKSSGFYVIQVNISANDTIAVDRLVGQLRARPDLVSFVTPALSETPPAPRAN